VGARAILAQDVSLDAVRRVATSALPPRADRVPELVRFDGQARKALELTYREALRLGHNYIGTEHVLLALLELEDGAGPLNAAGVDKAGAEAAISAALAAALAARQERQGHDPTGSG
jgi:hypothetical protein